MKPLPLSRIAQWTGGRLVGADATVGSLATDTRTFDDSGAATLFVALGGERFDGHDHVAAAAAKGATAALVARPLEVAIPQVVVADTTRALAALAGAMQRTRGTRVVAITGSNGKTSVKQCVLAILSRAGDAYANPGNRNNEIGLPLAVIEAPDDADVAVYEMGAGKAGDIAYLTAIARPDVALVNNVAPAHLERLGSLLAIAETKAAVYEALPADGVAVINADDAFAPFFAERAHGRRLIRFGFGDSPDITVRDVVVDGDGSHFVLVTPEGEVDVDLPLPGRHNIANAMAAASLALGCGVELATIAAGLRAVQAVAGRLVRHHLASGAVLVDDSYNANPGSLNAAIEVLAQTAGERWLVLGDMRELGADAEALHAEAGRRARAAGLSRVYALGALSAHAAAAFGDGGRVFESHEDLAEALRGDLEVARQAGGVAPTGGAGAITMVVKGSRGSAMDRVVAMLLQGDGAHAA